MSNVIGESGDLFDPASKRWVGVIDLLGREQPLFSLAEDGQTITSLLNPDGTPAAAFATSAGRHAIYIAAGSMTPSAVAGCAALATVATASGRPDLRTLDFDSITAEHAEFDFTPPPSWDEGTVSFAPVWSHADTTTDFGVAFSLQGVAVGNGDSITADFGTEQTSVDAGGTSNFRYLGPESAAITIAGSPGAEDSVFFRVSRVPGDEGDNLAVDARLHGIVLYITTNAPNDAI